MEATEFKSQVKELKGFLVGKEIIIDQITATGIETFRFSSLAKFGAKVLELEAMGAGFHINRVANDLIEKATTTKKELDKWVSRGSWSRVYITSSTL